MSAIVISSPFFYAIAFMNLISMAHIGLFMVGANVYDIKQFRKTADQKKHKSRHHGRPLVSIVIPAHNEAIGIERTLNSIRANSYKRVEIIVVDDGSTDDTVKVVRRYMRSLPQFRRETYMARLGRSKRLGRRYFCAKVNNVKITVVEQTNKGKGAAMNNGIANHARGSLVMCLDADSVLHPEAIKRAVAYFDNPDVMGVAANVRIMGGNNWLAILQRFEHMIGYRSKKFYTLAKCEFIIGGVASTYRRELLNEIGLYDTDTMTEDIGLSLKAVASQGNRYKRIVYAADVLASTEGVQTYRALFKQRYRWKLGSLQNLFKYRHLFLNPDDEKFTRRLTVYRLPMAIIGELLLISEPLLLGYIVYLSISHHALGILLGAYVVITTYALCTVWPDEHMTRKQKLQMSFLAFGIYIMFYAMDLVQVSAVFRCLKGYKKVIHRDQVKTTWVSPARSGQAA